jgi:hypothetical protein
MNYMKAINVSREKAKTLAFLLRVLGALSTTRSANGLSRLIASR